MLQIDKNLFLFLNGLNHPFLDQIMWQFSNTTFWLPLYLWILYLMIRKYKMQALLVVLAAFGLLFITDQTATIIKNMVFRLRPTHNPEIEHLVHTVANYKGGLYGFFSGHACNAFGVISFSLFLLKPITKWVWIILLAYALLTCYSRIYLGVHYPLDILVGAIIGSSFGIGMGYLIKGIIQKSGYTTVS